MDYAKPTDRPAIGTPAAALESCVTLISAVTGQPETLMGYYLDLYYQVRSQAEAAEADTSSAPAGAPSPQGEGNEVRCNLYAWILLPKERA